MPTTLGIAVAMCAFPGLAQESSLGELVQDGERIPTISELFELEEQARTALEAEGCAAASGLLVSVSSGANILANVIRQGLEPYYDANRDARDAIANNRSLLNELADAEGVGNQFIYLRNEFFVLEAECLAEMGERAAAIDRLYEALDVIGANRSERDVWERARDLLWELVGYPEGEE
jgi:hypothetical protein